METGQRKAGYSVVTTDKVIEASALLTGISVLKAELIALTRESEGQFPNDQRESRSQ